MFNAIVTQKCGGGAILGPTDTRDEASRLARAWIEANHASISPAVGQVNPVTKVLIEKVEDEED